MNCRSFLAPMIRPARGTPRCTRGDLGGAVSTRACCLGAESPEQPRLLRLLRTRRYAQDRRASLSPLGKQPGRILRHLLMHTGTGTHRHSNGEGAVAWTSGALRSQEYTMILPMQSRAETASRSSSAGDRARHCVRHNERRPA